MASDRTSAREWAKDNIFEIEITLFVAFLVSNIILFASDGSVGYMATALILAMLVLFFVMCTPQFSRVMKGEGTLGERCWLIVMFGALSIYGTVFCYVSNGVTVNYRDLGALIAGVVGGPLVGGAAGLIGGAFRMTLGGDAVVPCLIATVLAGIIAGLARNWILDNGWKGLLLLGLGMETLHILVLLPLFSMLMGSAMPSIDVVIATMYLPTCILTVAGLLTFNLFLGILRDREGA